MFSIDVPFCLKRSAGQNPSCQLILKNNHTRRFRLLAFLAYLPDQKPRFALLNHCFSFEA